MKEQMNSGSTPLSEQNSLQQLIEQLKPLHVTLSQNPYIKDTTNRLKQIINDAESQPIVLFVGKERVGKTTLINSLLGRNLLVDSKQEPTNVHTFIKYGEQECIKAVFLDGMVATFDISKLNLLTISSSDSVQIIREHIDYLEVYIAHDLLKEMTLIDSMALEIGANNTAYFSQSLLQRVDEVFWVLRAGSPATEDEVNFVKKLNTFGIHANVVINRIDEFEGNVTTFITEEKERYGDHIGEVVAVSALQALQARKTNNMQLLIDSRITQLTQLIHQLIDDKQKKTRHVVELFIQWLNRFRKEVESIPTKEPYISAHLSVEQYQADLELESTRKQRDLALITAYKEEYENVSKVFKEVQTLYQLLQKLASDLYLRDSIVEEYEEIAGLYQKNVRDYRKLHVDYTMEYARLEKQYKKQMNKDLVFPIPEEEMDGVIGERVMQLNNMQSQLVTKVEFIEKYGDYVRNNLSIVQNRLNELAVERLLSIQNQLHELNLQRKQEKNYVVSYVNKLSEFNCIVEGQSVIKDVIQPLLLEPSFSISEQEQAELIHTIECINTVDLTHHSLYDQLANQQPEDEFVQINFDTKYKLVNLSLTEADVISEIPEMPEQIEM